MPEPVVVADSVTKSYGRTAALRGVSLELRRGEILAVVGPNGAGKTTLVEIIEGLRSPTSGTVSVFGHDPRVRRQEILESIGVQLQDGGLNPRLTVGETVTLYASLFRRTLPRDRVLELAGLGPHERKAVRHLSGGERQRLCFALAIINDPAIVILDELTTGLDPEARREMWGLVSDLRRSGKTVILVTHYMEEAEFLSDRVAVLAKGSVVECGHPATLVANVVPGFKVVVDPWDEPLPQDTPMVYRVERRRGRLYLFTRQPDAVKAALAGLRWPDGRQPSVQVEATNLEDAYVALVREQAS
ncbi:MAG: ABC transporter ATP-binding protein [Firmicutes bacterium]|nr:ABC transporter ATP-binding protein [Bacillota bacterium]